MDAGCNAPSSDALFAPSPSILPLVVVATTAAAPRRRIYAARIDARSTGIAFGNSPAACILYNVLVDNPVISLTAANGRNRNGISGT
jgi:hypothetical protein